ncbi:19596_t:CDS:2 [Funneliformis geosporum]|nr:19596_t:CDS:2 [Funneliformis geosporum]
MSMKSIKYPFVDYSTIDAQYSLELQEHVTREEFNERINELNKTVIKNRINRAILFLPFIFIILVVSITLPLAFINVTSSSETDDSGDKPLTIWPITIASILTSIILSASVTFYILYKSRIKRFYSIIEKLNEFNAIDNQRGINWRIIYDVGRKLHGYYKLCPPFKCSQRFLMVEIGPPSIMNIRSSGLVHKLLLIIVV